ncbi:HTH-type transcriptional repressor FabR [Rhodoferax sp. PAMC 29310]|uniref:HTH-type transcriptional repressor FabR n=1 Tax=Rhodoferax sp. PAMC 29310 TaxID=2822760 RepID=UPI001B337B29|nr:HTH-type transcriptional repressor FabR [Rhodoferax sp. PAMC 29310]
MTNFPTASKRTDALTRSERKDLTRAILLQAALDLIGEGRSFTSLGIREIAREAGMVPNAFYRHFRNTDELGLALVEEVGITLRRLLREARQVGVAPNSMVRRSVDVYYEYVKQNRLQFLFISSERSGGSRILRLAIRNDVTHFTNEMAQDFRRLGVYPEMPTSSLQMVCGLIVTTMLAAAPEILDLPADQPLLEAEMTENFVQQLQVVLLGATCWKDKFTRTSTLNMGQPRP